MTLLQNHGLIVAGDDEPAIVERSEDGRRRGPARRRPPRAASDIGTPADAGAPATPRRVERLSRVARRARSAGTASARAVVFDGSPDAARVAGHARGPGARRRRSADARPDRVRRARGRCGSSSDVAAAPTTRRWRARRDGASPARRRTRRAAGHRRRRGHRRPRDGREAVPGRDRARALRSTRSASASRRLALGGVRAAGPRGARLHRDWEAEAYRRVRRLPGMMAACGCTRSRRRRRPRRLERPRDRRPGRRRPRRPRGGPPLSERACPARGRPVLGRPAPAPRDPRRACGAPRGWRPDLRSVGDRYVGRRRRPARCGGLPRRQPDPPPRPRATCRRSTGSTPGSRRPTSTRGTASSSCRSTPSTSSRQPAGRRRSASSAASCRCPTCSATG